MLTVRMWIFVVFAMCFAIGQASGQSTGLYKVINVGSDDVLNVRNGPGHTFQDLGDIAFNGQLQVVGFSADKKWAEIIWKQSTAWVAARYVVLLKADKTGIVLMALQCGGTEPFWSADIGPQAIAFKMMDGPEVNLSPDWAHPAQGRPADYIIGFSAGAMTGVLKHQTCSDGMSDIDYPWSLVLIDRSTEGPRVLDGCCST